MSALPDALQYYSKGNEYNALRFVIDQALAEVQSVSVVQVQACTNTGSLALAGTVNVQVLVNLMTADGTALKHGIVNGLPYVRMQGGPNAIILDPAVGDIGVALFCSRDISAVVANKKQSNPGSFRRFDWADGIYLGGLLNALPTNYVQFQNGTITVNAATAIDLTAPTTTVTGSLVVTGNATIDGRSFIAHEHSGVQSGSSNTGPVV
jgi:hypothetical protein